MQISNPMMFCRSIKGAPSSVLWVLVLVRQALTVRQLCAYTDYKPDSVREALDVLAGYEIVAESKLAHGEALYAIGKGYQFLLDGIDPSALTRVAALALSEPESENIGFCAGSDSDSQPESAIQNPIKSDSGLDEDTNNEPKSRQSPKKSDSGSAKTGSIMMIDDESLIINKSSVVMNPPGETLPELEVLLEGLDMLFGASLELADLRSETTARQLLAWSLKGWQDKAKLRNPLGMIRARLMANSPRSLPKNWRERFPQSYLVAIGAVEQPADLPESEAEQEAPEEWLEEFEPARGREMSINHAWRRTLEQLRRDMPRASYDRWVCDTHPLAWDGYLLQVGANTADARDWLENRLASTCGHLLSGMLNCSVELRFITTGADG